ncbi:helix-turn-helix domain-containing protein [Methylopila sp. M107]|uniref:winged helix-turn-helix transcriptional regulator n=1 Tax=Methylopila sp. M107 TaxID=1101190 RepID=UPI00036B1F90|nr:helix-turn-helix domain-containing protein [Methylopila sp. M107]
MTSKSELASLNCSLARALAMVGDSWSVLILRDAFLGSGRFGEFQRSLGIAKNILADRLERLVCAGLLIRENGPRYALTDKGRELLPALVALAQWGDRFASDGAPPMIFTDAEGRPVDAVALAAAGAPLDPSDLRVAPGPGADARTRAFLLSLSRP